MTLTDHIRLYLDNRDDFYRTLLPRIPHPGLRQALAQAVVFGPAGGFAPAEVAGFQPPESDPLLAALALRDALKKRGYGETLARTTISFAEALARAEQLEEAGLRLFERLLTQWPELVARWEEQAAVHRQTVAQLAVLSDQLRYHKIRL